MYLCGYGLQLEGENYFVPLDARIERAADVPVQAIRLSDYTRALGALKLKASIVVLDLARNHPFALEGEPLAGGLALVQPKPGMLICIQCGPGNHCSCGRRRLLALCQSLGGDDAREGGLPPDELFDRVRLRVSDVTQGAQVPWDASNAVGSFMFFERTAEAPPLVAASKSSVALRSRAIRDLGAQEAYITALDRDALPDYLEFLDSYGDSPLASRISAIVAARREALIWRRTRLLDTPAAYWSYLRIYSQGPHVGDCERQLVYLHAALEPPPDFDVVAYDIPPPVPQENTFIEQSAVFFGDPNYDFAPPPPIPEDFLPPPSPALDELPPPEVPETPFVLPTPVYIPVPVWVRPPPQLRAPAANNVKAAQAAAAARQQQAAQAAAAARQAASSASGSRSSSAASSPSGRRGSSAAAGGPSGSRSSSAAAGGPSGSRSSSAVAGGTSGSRSSSAASSASGSRSSSAASSPSGSRSSSAAGGTSGGSGARISSCSGGPCAKCTGATSVISSEPPNRKYSSI